MKKNMAWILMACAVTVLFCGCNGRNPGQADIAAAAPQSGNPLAQVEISVNGKTSGSTEITAHKNPKASSVAVTKWKPGTPVAVVEESEEFLLLEGKGYRGWVHQKYFTPDQPE